MSHLTGLYHAVAPTAEVRQVHNTFVVSISLRSPPHAPLVRRRARYLSRVGSCKASWPL